MKISINLHSEFYLVFHRSLNRIKYPVLVVAFLLSLSIKSYAKNFYLSSSTGNDSYTATQAQNPATPWKTINKLNSSMSLINPGDFILFKRGDEFTGQITLTRSGTAGAKIVFSSYGTGNLPIISGTLPVTSWTRYSGNIWLADCPQFGSTITNFFISGKSKQIGRYPNADAPNKGYLNIDSHIGSISLTSSSLLSGLTWTGGEVVVRTRRWILDRVTIQSHAGNTLNFGNPTTYEIYDNYGFFIQNHLGTLDQSGEWYFDSVNNKMYLYSSSDPNSLKTEATAYASTFIASKKSYFSIENIEFRGSINTTICINGSDNIDLANITVSESGTDAAYFDACININFINNKIINTNNNAVKFIICRNVLVRNNEIRHTAMRSGMGLSSDGQYHAMYLFGNNIYCESNVIDSVGYNGLQFIGDSVVIKNNYINHYCMTVDDGGGLYTWSNEKSVNYNRRLENNIILNGIGAGEGTDNPVYLHADGIYMDDHTSNVSIANNTVAYCNYGILIHNANHISITGNTLYNNNIQLFFAHDLIAPEYPITNCQVNNNIFYAKSDSQMVAKFKTIDNGILNFGTFDNNYYCRPIADDATILVEYAGNSGIISSFMNLATWQSTFNYDLNSKKSPYTISAFKITDLVSTNKIGNSNFNSDIKGWNYWSKYNNGYASWDNNSNLDGGCLKLGFNSLSNEPDGMFMLASSSFGETIADENYVLKFSMVTSAPDQIVKIIMRNAGIPYNDIAPQQSTSVDSKRKEFELLFTPDLTETNARIDFEIKEDNRPIWIDNVELFEVNIKQANIDDSIKFVYNSLNSNKVVSLDGSFIDVKGTKYSGSITLLPYTSAVLMIDRHPSAPPATPLYVSSAIENASPSILEMTYNATLTNVVPPASAFTVTVNSVPRSVNSVLISGSKVIMTLASAVVNGDVIMVAYTKPSSNALQTPEGGQATSISAQTVSNGVNAVVTPPVVVTPPPVVVTPPVVVPNTAPVAVVNYINGTYSGFVGELNATGSYDADKDNLSFTWKIPNNISVSATNNSVIEFLAPIVETKQTYDFTLTVSDGKTTQTKTIPIEVLPYQPGLETAEVIAVEAGDFQTPYFPYNAIDGNIETMWSAIGIDKWIILELKELFNIQHVKMAFQPGQRKESYFDVLGSNDKQNWEPVLTKSNSCDFSGDMQVFEFPPSKSEKEYRYLKLVGQGNSLDNWNFISEIRIFGFRHKNSTSYKDLIVKIYPNPAKEIVNILIDEPAFNPDFIKIVSLEGKTLFTDKVDPGIRHFQIPVNFKNGVYIVEMGTGDITLFTQKLIIVN